MKKFLAIVTVLALFIGYLAYTKPETPEPTTDLGATPGTDHVNHEKFQSGVTEGGVYTIATTSASWTLTNAEMRRSKVISISSTPFGEAMTLTLPASTTWATLDRNGTAQTWIIDNLHTAAGTTTTVTAGTGVDIDGGTANDDILNGGVSGTLTCWRLPNSDVRCIVEEFVDAG